MHFENAFAPVAERMELGKWIIALVAACKLPIYVGCAGWSLPKASAAKFGDTGPHLERYATRFNCVEINSSFYRPHRQSTYQRWADSVPSSFRFAVKIPKAITHTARLVPAEGEIAKFAREVSGLGGHLGCLLVQLPPSLAFDSKIARAFFAALEAEKPSEQLAVVCEPRHASWFAEEAEQLLEQWNVSRVVADPPAVAGTGPGDALAGHTAATDKPAANKWGATAYFRLHGSPRMYYSAYSPQFISHCAHELLESQQVGATSWCIFDNTAEGAATENALQLLEELQRSQAASARSDR